MHPAEHGVPSQAQARPTAQHRAAQRSPVLAALGRLARPPAQGEQGPQLTPRNKPTCKGRVGAQHCKVDHAGVVGHPHAAGGGHGAGAVIPDDAWREEGRGRDGEGAESEGLRHASSAGRKLLSEAGQAAAAAVLAQCGGSTQHSAPVQDTTNAWHRNCTSQRSARCLRWPCAHECSGGRAAGIGNGQGHRGTAGLPAQPSGPQHGHGRSCKRRPAACRAGPLGPARRTFNTAPTTAKPSTKNRKPSRRMMSLAGGRGGGEGSNYCEPSATVPRCRAAAQCAAELHPEQTRPAPYVPARPPLGGPAHAAARAPQREEDAVADHHSHRPQWEEVHVPVPWLVRQCLEAAQERIVHQGGRGVVQWGRDVQDVVPAG